MIKNYDIYNVLYYDKIILPEENKQIIKMYPTPYKIFNTEINEYVLVDEMFAAEKEIQDLIKESIYEEINTDILHTVKYDDYMYLLSQYIREYEYTDIYVDDSNIDITISSRTYEIEQIEEQIGIKIKRNYIWLDGAENTPGCIKQKTDFKDKFHYFFKNQNGEIKSEELKKYEEGMEKPYYTQDDEHTYMWLNHFSGGSGTQGDPFRINTRADFITFMTTNNSSAYFKQMNDIDFGGAANPLNITVSSFNGEYNGQNFKLLNIYYKDIISTTQKEWNLFPSAGSYCVYEKIIIDNLHVEKISSGNIYIFKYISQKLASALHNIREITFSNSKLLLLTNNTDNTKSCNVSLIGEFLGQANAILCYNNTYATTANTIDPTTTVTSSASGLIARMLYFQTTKVERCGVVDCKIKGKFSSGLLGFIYDFSSGGGLDTLNNSYVLGCNIGDLYTQYSAAISSKIYSGYTSFILKIKTSYFSANLMADISKKIDFAITNKNLTLSSTYLQSLYYDSNICPHGYLQITPTYLQPKTTAEMKTQATYVGFNFVTPWEIKSGIIYPEYPNLRERSRSAPTIIIPTVIRGFLRVNDITIPYYSFNEFLPPPRIVYRIQDEEALEQYFGLIDEPNTSGLYIAGAQVRTS